MFRGSSLVLVYVLPLVLATPGAAQHLPDPTRARAIDKCHVLLERTGTKVAGKALKALAICTNGVFKCVETKPGDAHCLAQARERCAEELQAHAAAAATLVNTVVRKCGSGSEVADLLDPAGLGMQRLVDDCHDRFGLDLATLADVGTCLAREHVCAVDRMLALAMPRAASLLTVARVDPAVRAALACLPADAGSDEHVGDARVVGRPVAACARAVTNAGLKLLGQSRTAIGSCLETLFTCAEVKTDPAAAPACASKARKRCALELANVTAAAARPAAALTKACGGVDSDVLAAPEGMRLGDLAAACTAVGGSAPTSLATYADCLARGHRCAVAELTRFLLPRADDLLAAVGTSLDAALCPAEAPPPTPTVTATPTPVLPTMTATPTGPSSTATPTPPAPTATGPTPSPTPGCADTYEPSAFPDAPVSLDALCPSGSCTDDGYDVTITATIDVPGDTDFYVLNVVDLPSHHFALTARLSDIPDGTNYDLYLYRWDGQSYQALDASTNDGTGNEVVSFSPSGDGESGRYGVEVRGVSGASCALYTLDIQNPN